VTKRLLLASGGGSSFHPPITLDLSGPYDPEFSPGATVLTQLHCHTTGSDGSQSPATVVASYLNRGYGALAITDHNVDTTQPAGITTAIPGNEHGTGTSMQHIIGINGAGYVRGSETDAQTIIDGIRGEGGEAHIAHPNWIGTSLSAATIAGLTNHYGIEIMNGKVMGGATGSVNPITSPGFAVSKWTDALAIRRDIWAVATDDLHKIDALNTLDMGRVQVFAASNTLTNVIASLVNGNFVADVANLGVTPGYPDRSGGSIDLTCTGAVRIEAWGSSGLLESASGTSLTHTPDGSSPYVRLVAIGDYTETFDAALPHHWSSGAQWTVGSGILSLDGTSSASSAWLRRHREGDFEAQIDTQLHDGGGLEGVNLMFNVLNSSRWYAIRIGQSGDANYNNKIAALVTQSSGSSQTLIDNANFTASMDTWYTIKMAYTAATGRIRAKVWETGTGEPDWMLDATSTTWTWGAFGLRANFDPDFDNLYISGFQTFYQPIRVD
jgi:hypothetical protein